ncbi:hypothetical protein AAC387_Pa09g1219 [Persea americana]
MQMEVVGGTVTWRGLTVKNIFSFVLVVFSVLIHVCIVGRAFRSSLMAANKGERSSDSSIGSELQSIPYSHSLFGLDDVKRKENVSLCE